ncbi:MAG: hypothetical protein CVU62_08060 [Deltaproteobacteria bacterium HGW-Deltaproteobacteria-2]|nr:MAG: hypothetical protein CVU62_08060 [Deltaproteobacteria bacterium HGW-Deltaproteobacteria-2]
MYLIYDNLDCIQLFFSATRQNDSIIDKLLNILFSSTVIEQVIAGLIAGLSAAALIKILTWITKPRLKMYFKKSETYTKLPNENGIDYLFMHLVIRNVKKTMAIGCRVFLLKLEEKKNNKFVEIPIKVHLLLKWSNENQEKGFNGLEIPGNYRRRIDLVCSEYNDNSKFSFYTEGGARGIVFYYPPGEYRLTIQATGENSNSITKRFIFKWHGNFIEKNINIEEEKFLYKILFKIRTALSFRLLFQL